ncbi:u3 snoRNA associated protein [Grosmannia clavigera kw1407]|uniref:U3 snoRNA associated protein n=1 Tax=Grosmannia clavigera (strain kw1407 / UAMH 11150) TaxID=655863 RepID=F0XST3_GROCL|nr:u3 snoRNA associated protein [Grosmannia clavigera kw1407]EFW99128.1 u3 snoRNA associated protein [Grosmannia clavigera kw1407]
MAVSKAAAAPAPASRPLRSSKRKSGGSVADLQSTEPMETDVASAAASGPVSKRRKLPVRTRADDAALAEETGQTVEDDEDDEDVSDSDSDDAPEAISTSQAVAATRQSAQRASQAAEKLAADQRRRRQDRDARLKEQAATRKAREADEEKEQTTAAAVVATKAKADTAPKPNKVTKLLPLEFLESDDEQSDDDEAEGAKKPSATGTAARRRNIAGKLPPRDRRQGSTVYRLLTDGGPRALAPKIRKYSRNVRKELVARKRTGRPISRGFLVKR